MPRGHNILPRKRWTAEEDAILAASLEYDDEVIATLMGRSIRGIEWRRSVIMGIKRDHTSGPGSWSWAWSIGEVKIIKENFSRKPAKDYMHLLPGRTFKEVWVKADHMGLIRFGSMPKEIRELTRLINRLNRKIHERETEHR